MATDIRNHIIVACVSIYAETTLRRHEKYEEIFHGKYKTKTTGDWW
jgi:hypothetical protein